MRPAHRPAHPRDCGRELFRRRWRADPVEPIINQTGAAPGGETTGTVSMKFCHREAGADARPRRFATATIAKQDAHAAHNRGSGKRVYPAAPDGDDLGAAAVKAQPRRRLCSMGRVSALNITAPGSGYNPRADGDDRRAGPADTAVTTALEQTTGRSMAPSRKKAVRPAHGHGDCTRRFSVTRGCPNMAPLPQAVFHRAQMRALRVVGTRPERAGPTRKW